MEHGLRLLTDFISHQGNKKTRPEDLRLQIWGVFFCLFVVFSHTREFLTHLETSQSANFDLCSALRAIEQ